MTITMRRLLAALGSAALLSPAWLGGTGLTLFAALVPLLWISHSYGDSRREWWGMFGWAALTFVAWNAATVWWIWYATPVGPVAATIASTFLNMVAFMLYHTAAQKAKPALAWTLLVSAWIATEYAYTVGDFSWPWLLLGNGFSHDVWMVQWYEYTGIFGGTLWVLICNILIFRWWQNRRSRTRAAVAAAALLLPMAVSLLVRAAQTEPSEHVRVAVIQPNVDPYAKFDDDPIAQRAKLLELLGQVPGDTDFVLMPETAITPWLDESAFHGDGDPEVARYLQPFVDTLAAKLPRTMIVTGANTLRTYTSRRTETARLHGGVWYDHFNTALALDTAGVAGIHHKGRLVIGVENTPTWVFRAMEFLVIDLGGVVGQIGVGQDHNVFKHNGIRIGSAICYEGLYGDFFGGFVRSGADVMGIVSNDGWWDDTPGYRHLFTLSRLRAVEHRRAIARSANTGRSGFIDPTGRDIGPTLGWAERGVVVWDLPVVRRVTCYTRYGDILGRLASYVMALSLLYYAAWRIRRRNHLVD